MQVSVQAEPFDLGALSNAFAARVAGAGAVVTFTGLVRDNGGSLAEMEIEHYPGMTEKAIAGMVDQAVARWALHDALVVHRYGRLMGGGPDHAADDLAAVRPLNGQIMQLIGR